MILTAAEDSLLLSKSEIMLRKCRNLPYQKALRKAAANHQKWYQKQRIVTSSRKVRSKAKKM